MDQAMLPLSGQTESRFLQLPQTVRQFKVTDQVTVYPGDSIFVSMPTIGEDMQISIVRGAYVQPPAAPIFETDALPHGMDILAFPDGLARAVGRIILNGRGDDRPFWRREYEIGWAVTLIKQNEYITTEELLKIPSLGCSAKNDQSSLVRVLVANATTLGIIFDTGGERRKRGWKWLFVGVPPESALPPSKRKGARRK
jgi:hypothetical protein